METNFSEQKALSFDNGSIHEPVSVEVNLKLKQRSDNSPNLTLFFFQIFISFQPPLH